jgi:hypothetical protein
MTSSQVVMPEMYGFARTYVKDAKGKFAEQKDSQTTREKIIKAQKEKLETMSKSV